MKNELKISMLKNRISLLSGKKGVSNTAIINKINRKIRQLEKNS